MGYLTCFTHPVPISFSLSSGEFYYTRKVYVGREGKQRWPYVLELITRFGGEGWGGWPWCTPFLSFSIPKCCGWPHTGKNGKNRGLCLTATHSLLFSLLLSVFVSFYPFGLVVVGSLGSFARAYKVGFSCNTNIGCSFFFYLRLSWFFSRGWVCVCGRATFWENILLKLARFF